MWEDTGTKPDAIANRPTLIDRWQLPLSIWKQLKGSRPPAMSGATRIPFSEFFLFCFTHSISREDMQWLWEDFHKLDDTWADLSTKNQEASTPKKTSAKVAPQNARP